MKRQWKLAVIIVAAAAVVGVIYLRQPRGTLVDLRQNSAIQQIHIQYNWMWNTGVQNETYEISCSDQETCSATGQKYLREHPYSGGYITKSLSPMSIPYQLVTALNDSLVNFVLPADQLAPYVGYECVDHTDDYPHFVVEIVFASGQLIKLTSSCNTRIPWETKWNGKVYVQKTGDIPTAYHALVGAIDHDHGR